MAINDRRGGVWATTGPAPAAAYDRRAGWEGSKQMLENEDQIAPEAWQLYDAIQTLMEAWDELQTRIGQALGGIADLPPPEAIAAARNEAEQAVRGARAAVDVALDELARRATT
jgi:hypothetical protein